MHLVSQEVFAGEAACEKYSAWTGERERERENEATIKQFFIMAYSFHIVTVDESLSQEFLK